MHPQNRGYGGNQKTCYGEALRRGADIVIMLHPDYQYTPKLIGAMAWYPSLGHGMLDQIRACKGLAEPGASPDPRGTKDSHGS